MDASEPNAKLPPPVGGIQQRWAHVRPVFGAVALVLLAAPTCAWAARPADGQLEIEVVDSETGQPLAARMHLKSSRGRPVKIDLAGVVRHADHFYIDGRVTLPLRTGQYTFELESGPEYRTRSGHFEIERHADDSETIEMNRFAKLADEGWWAGDLDMARPPSDMALIMRAEQLSVVPTVARRHEGGLIVLEPRNRSGLSEVPSVARSSLDAVRDARAAGQRVVARTPFAWDLPVWLASGELDAVELIHHHSLRSSVVDNEDDGRPRDRELFPGRTGNGRWSEAIYYHLLNCGLRVPPAAGSGSGANDNPAGQNRVYVYCGNEFSPERWWDGLDAGRVFVTNGPLLRPLVEGHPPGYVFRISAGEKLELEIGLNLATRVPVDYLEIIKDGHVADQVRLSDWTKSRGRLPPIEFNASGWFLVRAVTNDSKTYQFASSAPYYVEQNGRPRVSRASVQFFLDWIDQRITQLRTLASLDDATRAKLLAEQDAARQFFQEMLAKANAD